MMYFFASSVTLSVPPLRPTGSPTSLLVGVYPKSRLRGCSLYAACGRCLEPKEASVFS